MRKRVLAFVALAALAGCGDELEEFREHLRPLEERAEAEQSVTSGLLRSLRLGSRTDARDVRTQAAKLAAIYDEIAAVDPPDDYAKPFAEYVRANDESVRDLRRFADELESGHLRGMRRASARVLADLGRGQTARLQWLE